MGSTALNDLGDQAILAKKKLGNLTQTGSNILLIGPKWAQNDPSVHQIMVSITVHDLGELGQKKWRYILKMLKDVENCQKLTYT